MPKLIWLFDKILFNSNKLYFKSSTMGLIFMPRKSAFIIFFVLGIICMGDGIIKKDIKESLVGLAFLLYAIISLLASRKKNLTKGKNNKIRI